eukprot:TRINITY_DN4966_c0_g1_i1.p1 TRINITY_DN4966_c0_g1~~TRINITY_DN4966_c0_g1_i1.p1  ORF type:complete len:2275 (-),score=375.89 TRINITY_DN4966_c0_g1_i1:31-6855(-)
MTYQCWHFQKRLFSIIVLLLVSRSESQEHRQEERLNISKDLQQPPEQSSLSQGDLFGQCRARHKGLPIRGIQYVPHLVGEPYPFPDSDPQGYYSSIYSTLHERDLPLIGQMLQADTLRIRPWPLEASNRNEAHTNFLNTMKEQGICKLVPTFHLAKYYAEMLKQGKTAPETDSSSHLSSDFVRFGGTVDVNVLRDVEIVGWSVDLSLDLFKLLPLVQSDCKFEPKDDSYFMWKSMLQVLVQWVRQQGPAGSAAPALKEVPLLVPLDLSQIDWTQSAVRTKLVTLLECMGQWNAPVFGDFPDIPRSRWLLSFAIPYESESEECNDKQDGLRCFPFKALLMQLATQLNVHNTNAVIMVGTQALTPDPVNNPNPVQDYGSKAQPPQQQIVLQRAYQQYLEVNASQGNLDGFILDEWQDDWDRGTRGPFFLAVDTVEAMKDTCEWGGRFSHDIGKCSRPVGWGHVFPEFFGQAATVSSLWRHCLGPRFRRDHFSFNASAQDGPEGRLPLDCRILEPHYVIVCSALGLIFLVCLAQTFKTSCRSCKACCRRKLLLNEREDEEAPESLMKDVASADKPSGHVTITPKQARLRGGHAVELRSHRIRSQEEVGWWLWSHLSAQQSVLERQIQAEVNTLRALRSRAKQILKDGEADGEDSDENSDSEDEAGFSSDKGDDLSQAMVTVHRRVLEGVAAWCAYVLQSVCLPRGVEREQLKALASNIDENETRPLPKLFAEALLLRTMESVGEHVLHCPERLALLYFKAVCASQEEVGDDDHRPASFSIDLEKLQDGLEQMEFHSNPFERKKMPNGKRQLGLNFDDINESGIQCREGVAKTFKEPRSAMVLVDFLICYRVPFMLKSWTFLIAIYWHLGTGLGDDITTSFNGTWFQPKWLRLNFIQYTAAADALAWVLLEITTLFYTSWQRWPSLSWRSPGVPGIFWMLKHFLNACFSATGLVMVWSNAKFVRKPWQCRQSDLDLCVDARSKTFQDLAETLQWAVVYWIGRVIIFFVMNRRSFPMFIHGTPGLKTRREGGRGFWDKAKSDFAVNLAWVLMLLCCMAIEVYIILPAMRGLDLSTACGLDMRGEVLGIPHQVGVCSEQENWLGFGCVTCVGSVFIAVALVFLGSMVDVYFVFYIFSAIFGSVMGHNRHLNDVKNISVPIDLRPGVGKDAFRFEVAFGPQWQMVWQEIVQSLLKESFISPRMAKWLSEAAGISMDGQELMTRRDRKEMPIHLSRYPQVAAERLAFFFQSLEWIQAPGNGIKFRGQTDALTASSFDPGTVPSLTQIIPVYQEVIIPSAEFLCAGALPEDAMNQSPDDQHGVGDLTGPPLGDGVNTNLAFIISQFPDEWIFLAKRLFAEGALEGPNAHDLFKAFVKRKLRDPLIVEVRLWAAMRTQSVAKTVVGALQYERALAALPKMKQYYAQFPGKRNPEDHAELILSHQTYGMKPPLGSPENDESVQLLLSKYACDSIFLVFDLTPQSDEKTWHFVEAFLIRRGGYQLGTFTYASVKCKWDSPSAGLAVVEVLPRKFPLRIGQGDYKTQGKACNQLNALRFASGHYIQALDCNMGVFMGEAFKVPYVLRLFMPLDKRNRVATRCRYLGFREHIFTGRDGAVGKCHAAAEWTFGTIYQRFLSGMGTRMHYGHPDFVDGFWARNRGGMSKGSPVVNLSEDIFAGYNVHMREEASPHVDALEFEKGREAAFNAASAFFSKIAGGSVAIIRSRDNHLLCEKIGILHSLSFYFTSVAFYVSNLLIDISIQLYVLLFIFFTLANIDLTKLSALGSSFSSEWILSLGIVSLFPQLFEMILEFGAVRACKEVFGGLCASTIFFIFQNKSIAAAMRDGAASGVARYFSTGRPLANQHPTWKDSYCAYWKSHYAPAIRLMMLYMIYNLIASQTFQGRLPMFLVVTSFVAWVVTPIIFSPFPRVSLIEQDLREFNGFINGRAGMSEKELQEVVDRGRKGRVRTIFECGLADSISYWSDMPFSVLIFNLTRRLLMCVILALAMPSEIMDFLWVYLVVLSVQWMLVLGFFAFSLSNILLVLSLVVWLLVLPVGRLVIGARAHSPSLWVRMPEYIISFLVLLEYLGFMQHSLLILCRVVLHMKVTFCCIPEANAKLRLHQWVRLAHVYFFEHQLHKLQAYIILVSNVVTSLILTFMDKACGNVHTWWLLNNELAMTKSREQYLENRPTLLEQELQRNGHPSETSSQTGHEASEDSSSSTEAPSLSHLPHANIPAHGELISTGSSASLLNGQIGGSIRKNSSPDFEHPDEEFDGRRSEMAGARV